MEPTTPSAHPVTERLQRGADVTKDELQALRLTVHSMPAQDRKDLSDAIDSYAQSKQAMLAENVETESALLALRRALTQKKEAERGTLETMGTDAGATAGRMADTVVRDVTALGYREWKKLRDPEQHTSSKIFSVLGIAAAGYGLYRLAKWVKGKDTDSFWGKAFKFLGVTAGAGLLLHWLAPSTVAAPKTSEAEEPKESEPTPPSETKEAPVAPPSTKKPDIPAKDATKEKDETPKKSEPTKPSKSPVSAPAAIRKTKPAPEKKETKEAGILQDLPDGQNLVGGKFLPFTMKGKKHTIKFTSDSLFIDSKKFEMTAVGAGPFGGDVSLSIYDAKRNGDSFMFRAGAYGKEGTVKATGPDLEAILEKLLSGRPYETTTAQGQRIQISSSNY